MIKILIKHKLFEWCIDSFFEPMFRHFSNTPNKKFNQGTHFKTIIYKTFNGDCSYIDTLHNVTVLSDPHVDSWGRNEMHVHVGKGLTEQRCLDPEPRFYANENYHRLILIDGIVHYD